MNMYDAYLGLGSNIEPNASLNLALDHLKQAFILQKVSSWYESSAFFLPTTNTGTNTASNTSIGTQKHIVVPAFTNLMLSVSTPLNYSQVKTTLKQIEQKIEPKPSEQAHRHRIDIDLYAHEQESSQTITPLKKEVLQAAYVLVPLLEIAPHLRLTDNQPLADYLVGIEQQQIEKL